MPDFLRRTRDAIASDQRFCQNDLSVEHYIISTGLRQMIIGNPINEEVDGVWACELLSDPPGPEFRTSNPQPAATGVVSQVGYVLDNTTKTRAVFEINKGANKEEQVDVNAMMADDERRVPIRNMIYIADGPSDVPVFSVVGGKGGKTLGVYTLSEPSNYEQVKDLQEQGRIHSMAEANYREGEPADRWLMSSLRRMATDICDSRDRTLAAIPGPPRHVT
jgi:hypothetical protein